MLCEAEFWVAAEALLLELELPSGLIVESVELLADMEGVAQALASRQAVNIANSLEGAFKQLELLLGFSS